MPERIPGRRPVAGTVAVLLAVSVWGGMAVVLSAVGVVALRTARSSVGEQGHGKALVAAE